MNWFALVALLVILLIAYFFLSVCVSWAFDMDSLSSLKIVDVPSRPSHDQLINASQDQIETYEDAVTVIVANNTKLRTLLKMVYGDENDHKGKVIEKIVSYLGLILLFEFWSSSIFYSVDLFQGTSSKYILPAASVAVFIVLSFAAWNYYKKSLKYAIPRLIFQGEYRSFKFGDEKFENTTAHIAYHQYQYLIDYEKKITGKAKAQIVFFIAFFAIAFAI